MMPPAAQQIAQQLRSLPPEKRIILIHPNLKIQHLALSGVLQNIVYLRFQGQNLDEAQLRAQLDAALQEQSGEARLDGKPGDLTLDEADRVAPDALADFLTRVLSERQFARILILSRVLPEHLLDDADIRRQSSFIPSDARLMLWDYAENAGTILLEVRAFGDGRVHLNGQGIASWDGALPRALFFYLIDRGMVTRAEIFQTFWPNLTSREATNVFHVTKRKISEVLGTELTVYGSSFYHVSPKIQLSYDVSLFNQLVQESEEGDADALRQALALYRGNYLMSLKGDWVLNRRESLQQAACDALIALGKMCESSGNPREALACNLRATRLKPEREDAAFAAMRLYRDLQMPQAALRVYRRLSKTLRDKLKVTPSQQVQQLAAQIEQSLGS